MKILKKILKNNIANYIIAKILKYYIIIVHLTSKWEIYGKEYVEQYHKENKPMIFIFWHGRMGIMPKMCPKDRKMNVVISTHRDGLFIADVMKNFNFNIISGSTNRNGSQTIKNIIRSLKNHHNVALTPDGPRGPRMRINSNIVAIAGLTGFKIIPLTFTINKYKIMNTWDKLMFPLPFSSGIMSYGKPIFVENNKDRFEEERIRIENILNDLTMNVDKQLNIKEKILPE